MLNLHGTCVNRKDKTQKLNQGGYRKDFEFDLKIDFGTKL